MSDNSIMTQEQIEEMLRNAGQVEIPATMGPDLDVDSYLTKDEQDALGEMGNICMGTSATTMYTLLGKQVQITTPMISVHTWETLAAAHPLPLVVVEVCYTEGIQGNNLLLLKEYDVALITDLLIGGDGNLDPNNIVLDEISLSAIREVMNQMVGSSSTSLAQMLNKTINISTPESKRIILAEDKLSDVMKDDGPLVKIAFKMEIEGLLSSEIMQILPAKFAQELAHELLNPSSDDSSSAQSTEYVSSDNVYTQQRADQMPTGDEKAKVTQSEPSPSPVQQAPVQQAPAAQTPIQQAPAYQQQAPVYQQQAPVQEQPMYQQPPMQQPVYQQPPMQQPYPPYGGGAEQAPNYGGIPGGYQQYPQYPPYPPQQYPQYPPQGQQYPPYQPQQQSFGAIRDGASANVQDVKYPEFGVDHSGFTLGDIEAENIRRMLDVPMEVMVDLGRVSKTIGEILEFNTGSVVVLNKQAGELVEVLVNGIQIARGEVVVIDDNYGVRITELNKKKLGEIAKKN